MQSHKKAAPQIRKQVERIDQLQYLLYADASQSLLIVLQAPDAGGKDGVIRHLFTGMNPQGTTVFGFKQPSQMELAHDFLWRAHLRAPGHGEVVIYNRSVHQLVSRPVWFKRYELINGFEKMLAENRTRIRNSIYISAPTSSSRASNNGSMIRPGIGRSAKAIYSERELWPQYVEAYEEAISSTSTKWAPWYVIPANHKWFRNLAISQIVADTMEEMGLRTPPPRVDLAEIRRKYHAAERELRDR